MNCFKLETITDAINIGNYLYQKGDFEAAEHALHFGFQLLQNKPTDPSKEELKKLYGIGGDVYGELGLNEKAKWYYENLHFLLMQLKNDIFEDNSTHDTITLFQFRRFSDYTLNNLLKKEVTLSLPSQMNDLVDCLVYSWLSSSSFGLEATHKNHLNLYRQSFNDYRIASFCCDNLSKNQYAVTNTLMWAHYANSHYGFCVEYLFHKDDFRKDDIKSLTASRMMKVKYIDPYINPINFEKAPRSISPKIGFLTKSIDWQYENEIRIIQFKPKNGELREQYQLDPKTKIKAIYFGCRCPQANIDIIKNLMKGRNIQFFQMEIDYSNVHILKFNEI